MMAAAVSHQVPAIWKLVLYAVHWFGPFAQVTTRYVPEQLPCQNTHRIHNLKLCRLAKSLILPPGIGCLIAVRRQPQDNTLKYSHLNRLCST